MNPTTGTVPFYVAVDISGPDERDSYVVCGAVAGLVPAWNIFELEWGAFLQRHGLSHLRMAEAMGFRGPFERKSIEWGVHREDRRDHLLSEAAQLVYSRLGRCANSYDDKDLRQQSKRSKYSKQLMFQSLVRQLILNRPDEEVFVFFCDEDQEVALEFYKGVERFKRQDRSYARRIAGVCFFDDARLMSLQAADMVAYVDRQRRAGVSSPLHPILFPTSGPQDFYVPYIAPPEP